MLEYGWFILIKDKLKIIEEFSDVSVIDWQTIKLDENNDWLNQRDPNFQKYVDISSEVFYSSAIGVASNRDVWVSSFSKSTV